MSVAWLIGFLALGGPVRMAQDPALSPDGKTLVFAWRGDLWRVSSQGGAATPLTRHPAKEREPKFSPDGKTLAFVSDREGFPQVYEMPATGGEPTPRSFHTAGAKLEDFFPDSRELLIGAGRDHSWNARADDRLFRLSRTDRKAEKPLFDGLAREGRVSPDGTKLLFTREGEPWWRKGYRGSQSGQIWLHDFKTGSFTQLLDRRAVFGPQKEAAVRSPLWWPDGNGFWFVGTGPEAAGLHLRSYAFDAKVEHFVAALPGDDTVVAPTASRDGRTIVFRHLWDLYRLDLLGDSTHGAAGAPVKLAIDVADDLLPPAEERKALTSTTEAAFTSDGLEVAFVANGWLWAMDTELREPVLLATGDVHDPTFSPDGSKLVYTAATGAGRDLFVIERTDPAAYWWQYDVKRFSGRALTADEAIESRPRFRPDGKALAYAKGRGDLVVQELDLKDGKPQPARVLIGGFQTPQFDWAPDGQWLAATITDDDFNTDVAILKADGSRPPFNVSRHPHDDGEPVWSPDGKTLAFVGRRRAGTQLEADIHYVALQANDDRKTKRERTLETALEKMRKGRAGKGKGEPKPDVPNTPPTKVDPTKSEPAKKEPPKKVKEAADQQRRRPAAITAPEPPAAADGKGSTVPAGPAAKRPTNVKVAIDFDGLAERVRRVTIADSNEGNLLWSPDGKKLLFEATVEGKRGVHTIEFPDNLKPTLLTATGGNHAAWLDNGQIVWVAGGVPASLTVPGGKATPYPFRALQAQKPGERFGEMFDECWRTMRDSFYDPKLGNRDWAAIRTKYREAATQMRDLESFAIVVNLMLGELNGSHLGFYPGRSATQTDPPATAEAPASSWRATTHHLGVRFDPTFAGPGLKIKDVLTDGPADRDASRLRPGEIVMRFTDAAGRSLPGMDKPGPDFDLSLATTVPAETDIHLVVKAADGKERQVAIRPITYAAAKGLLYEDWIRGCRRKVDTESAGTLGYLHIKGMDWASFTRLEEELFKAGHGKQGLVIDVRDNGGGSTADHLLTVLCQPRHAVTVPRGGGEGYPSDRIVYTTWNKPIAVLCNQNSFSNAEIFSHAIKKLNRGKLVGVPTAGGVISTGGTNIRDGGLLRLPFRGWFDPDTGEDMELRGAAPDVVLWPTPADEAAGRDGQLSEGVKRLRADVAAAAKAPKAKPKFNSGRPAPPPPPPAPL